LRGAFAGVDRLRVGDEAGHVVFEQDAVAARSSRADPFVSRIRAGAERPRERRRTRRHLAQAKRHALRRDGAAGHAEEQVLHKLNFAIRQPSGVIAAPLNEKTGLAGIPCAAESVASARRSRFGCLCSLGAGIAGREASSISLVRSASKSDLFRWSFHPTLLGALAPGIGASAVLVRRSNARPASTCSRRWSPEPGATAAAHARPGRARRARADGQPTNVRAARPSAVDK
jgi:hypothetical protein